MKPLYKLLEKVGSLGSRSGFIVFIRFHRFRVWGLGFRAIFRVWVIFLLRDSGFGVRAQTGLVIGAEQFCDP